jgi:hypothetical protein
MFSYNALQLRINLLKVNIVCSIIFLYFKKLLRKQSIIAVYLGLTNLRKQAKKMFDNVINSKVIFLAVCKEGCHPEAGFCDLPNECRSYFFDKNLFKQK